VHAHTAPQGHVGQSDDDKSTFDMAEHLKLLGMAWVSTRMMGYGMELMSPWTDHFGDIVARNNQHPQGWTDLPKKYRCVTKPRSGKKLSSSLACWGPFRMQPAMSLVGREGK